MIYIHLALDRGTGDSLKVRRHTGFLLLFVIVLFQGFLWEALCFLCVHGTVWPRPKAGMRAGLPRATLLARAARGGAQPSARPRPAPVLQGGFVTSSQASRAWMLSLSEWVTRPLAGKARYQAGGLRTGAAARHILVFDRWVGRVLYGSDVLGSTQLCACLHNSPLGAGVQNSSRQDPAKQPQSQSPISPRAPLLPAGPPAWWWRRRSLRSWRSQCDRCTRAAWGGCCRGRGCTSSCWRCRSGRGGTRIQRSRPR